MTESVVVLPEPAKPWMLVRALAQIDAENLTAGRYTVAAEIPVYNL